MPAYNPSREFLEQSLHGILAQDPGPEQMQIEVVDDCSPGMDVAALVREIAGDRVKVSKTPKNLGIADCFNTCIALSRGEWVHILSQDDLVFPGFYAALKVGAEKYPEAGAALCRHAYCDENGHWHRLSILEMPSPGLLQHFVEPLVTAERVQCAAIVVRRSTYEQLGGFNPDLKHALDWEMWIRTANKFPFYYEPKILACWRNHAGATTSRQIRSGENIRDHAKAIKIWSRYLPEKEAHRLANLATRRFAQAGLSLARDLLAHDDAEGSLNQAKAAVTCRDSFGVRVDSLKIQLRARKRQISKPIKAWLRKYLK